MVSKKKIKKAPLPFQETILAVQKYWSKKGLKYMKEKYNKVFQDEFKEYGYTE